MPINLSMKILYIEDDRIDQLAFKRLVKKIPGLACELSSYVAEGVARIQQGNFDLILSDHRLSDGSAMDVLKAAGGTPVIVTSGTQYPEEVEAVLKAGAIAHLLKPISLEQVEEVLAKIAPNHPADQAPTNSKEAFDLSYLYSLSDGDTSFEKEMLEIFVQEVPQSLASLQQELSANNWASCAELVHRLRSKIRILGLHKVRDLASTLEHNFKYQENIPQAVEDARELIHALEESTGLAQALITDHYAHSMPDRR